MRAPLLPLLLLKPWTPLVGTGDNAERETCTLLPLMLICDVPNIGVLCRTHKSLCVAALYFRGSGDRNLVPEPGGVE